MAYHKFSLLSETIPNMASFSDSPLIFILHNSQIVFSVLWILILQFTLTDEKMLNTSATFHSLMIIKSSRILVASMISALLLVSAISITQSGNAQITGKFTADLQPREGSTASGKANLELQGEEKMVMYTITGTGLNNITGITISQETGTGRAPDVVTIRTASQSGIEPSSGEREIAKGNFTASDLMGPLQGKSLADFVKAIDEGKIIIRVSTGPYPLGEIYGNVTAGQ